MFNNFELWSDVGQSLKPLHKFKCEYFPPVFTVVGIRRRNRNNQTQVVKVEKIFLLLLRGAVIVCKLEVHRGLK